MENLFIHTDVSSIINKVIWLYLNVMSVIDISTLLGFAQFYISTLDIVNFAKSCDYHVWKTFNFLYDSLLQKLVVDTLF